MTAFNNNTTFVNCNESDEIQFIQKGRDHFENVVSCFEFWSENGTHLDGHEYENFDGLSRRQLLEEGHDRHEVKEILAVLETFSSIGSFHEYGLCFDFIEADENSDGYYRFQICWGGPSSEIRFFQNGNIEAVYMDWYVGVGFNVSTHEDFEWCKSQFEDCGVIDWDSKEYEELYQDAHTFEDCDEEEEDA
ncbi:hypothetical protein NVP1121O_126 [Vibrio phage 1.121.O._10N.286.46.C4]|nr:hypothetical protein NVP1121O_126 [Vibrio phage 1.121.O._10N.286.46.C4]